MCTTKSSIGIIIILFISVYSRPSKQIVHVFDLPPVNYSLADAVKTDVTYKVFNNNNVSGVYVDEETAIDVIDPDVPTKLLIHGWLSNESTYWYGPYRDACLKRDNYNIIYVDWSKAGAKNFYVSAANSKPIGYFIGDFIVSANIKLKNVHIIGHSLGAHVAGFIGKRIFETKGSKVDRITCTDPAGPSFEHTDVNEANRVSQSDAEFVDVIHTDIGHYGFIKPMGHVDFYPNGGTRQPGCPSYEEDDNCSHARSNWYLIESVNSTGFLATQCMTWEDYVNGKCATKEEIVFGEDVPKTARGVYYFHTNNEPPFALK